MDAEASPRAKRARRSGPWPTSVAAPTAVPLASDDATIDAIDVDDVEVAPFDAQGLVFEHYAQDLDLPRQFDAGASRPAPLGAPAAQRGKRRLPPLREAASAEEAAAVLAVGASEAARPSKRVRGADGLARPVAPPDDGGDDDDDDDDDDELLMPPAPRPWPSTLFGALEAAPLVTSELLFYEYACYWTHRLALEAHDARVPQRLEFYGTTELARSKTDGTKRFELVQRTLDLVSSSRSEWQKRLHMQMIRATLFQILASDYDAQVDQVCEMMGWRGGPKQELMAIASRRSGKTYGTAIYAATMMLCIPNLEIVIFSLSKRQSAKMLALIAQFVLRTEKGRKMLDTLSVERMVLRGTEGPVDVRTCLSFPGAHAIDDVRVRPISRASQAAAT